MNEDLRRILDRVRDMTAGAGGDHSLVLSGIASLLHDELPGYDWAGFYMLDPEDSAMLVLGPYAGEATEHTRISVSEGICGAAVSQAATVVVDDVHSDPRHIACSLATRSEIVAPIYVRGKIVGEIDIDSHAAARFGSEDRAFVEACAAAVGRWMERS